MDQVSGEILKRRINPRLSALENLMLPKATIKAAAKAKALARCRLTTCAWLRKDKGLLRIDISSLTASRRHGDRQSVADSAIINFVLIAEKPDTRTGNVLPHYAKRRMVLLLKVRES